MNIGNSHCLKTCIVGALAGAIFGGSTTFAAAGGRGGAGNGAVGGYAADLDASKNNWNTLYGTNVILTGWSLAGDINNASDRAATIAEMTDPTGVYVADGDVSNAATVTARLLQDVDAVGQNAWQTIVNDTVAIGQHKIKLHWQFVANGGLFDTIAVANDDAVNGIKLDSMLTNIVGPAIFQVASGSMTITWLWGSERGKIDWSVTCVPPGLCINSCNAYMTLGSANITCIVKKVGNCCQLDYGYSWATPLASASATWNALGGTWTFSVGGIGSAGTGSGTVVDCCPPVVACAADIAPPGGDMMVNVSDLLTVINGWGPCATSSCVADINHDHAVNVGDLLAVINSWGPCSGQPQIGACCMPGGFCMPNVPSTQCQQQGGTFLGQNSQCSPSACHPN